MKLAYKIALFCGLAPLIIAVFILAGWFTRGEEEFLIAGLFNIVGGVILFVIGICCLIFYEYKSRQQHHQSAWKKLLKPFLIMIANFPAAAGCVYLVIFLASVSVVSVTNQTQEYIPAINLSSDKFIIKPIKGVMPGNTIKKYRRIKQSGPIDYSFKLNGQELSGNLVAYASRHQGRNVVMTISENGQVSVEEKLRRGF